MPTPPRSSRSAPGSTDCPSPSSSRPPESGCCRPTRSSTRLGQSLDLLDRGGRDLPVRQQTLRGAIGWSHDLLDEPTRRLFARMSVFAGGARLDEIEAVCGPANDLGTDVLTVSRTSSTEPRPGRGGPRRASLRDAPDRPRIRRRAAGGSDEVETIRRRHAETYLALAEQAAPELIGSDQRTWLDLLEDEHDNLGAAIDWAVEAKGPACPPARCRSLALLADARPPRRRSRPDRGGIRDP